MKITKLGIFSLIMVMVMGLTGIGYSMWSQTINITGSVNTGCVKLTTSNYSGSWAYKVLNPTLATDSETVGVPAPSRFGGGTQLFPNDLIWAKGLGYAGAEIKPMGYLANPNNYLNVGYAEWTSITNGGLTLAGTWFNLFPVPNATGTPPAFTTPTSFKGWSVDFDVTNAGTIPTKFVVNFSPLTPPATNGNIPGMVVSYTTSANVPITTGLQGVQLEPGQWVHVIINFAVNEETAQSYNGGFTASIIGEQWNEYVAPPTGP